MIVLMCPECIQRLMNVDGALLICPECERVYHRYNLLPVNRDNRNSHKTTVRLPRHGEVARDADYMEAAPTS